MQHLNSVTSYDTMLNRTTATSVTRTRAIAISAISNIKKEYQNSASLNSAASKSATLNSATSHSATQNRVTLNSVTGV